MDKLLSFIGGGQEEVDVATLIRLLETARTDPNGVPVDENGLREAMKWLENLKTLPVGDTMELLAILFPQLAKHTNEAAAAEAPTAANDRNVTTEFTRNIIDEIDNDDAQTVPEPAPRSRAPGSSLDSYSRRRTSPVKRHQASSTAEGSRLRSRNIAGMSNDEYDALASNIQPQLVNDIASYATQAGIRPSYTSATATAEQAYKDHPTLSDPRLHTVRTSPPNSTYDMPISPDSSFREPISPMHEALSPTRYAELDDSSRKHIQELLSKKAELQKMVSEKERRLELIEGQYEKRTVALERELDECKAELTMKKRDIERLKLSEKSYMENLQIAESEVERMGVSLSNSTAQSADMRRQLDTKTSQLNDANRRALDNQAEVAKLKSSLGSNQQLQEQVLKEHRRLELQYQELEHELKAAREFKDEAAEAQRENVRLSDMIDTLNLELKELRLQLQQAASADQDLAGANGPRRAGRKFKSLQDELAQLDAGHDLGVDDLIPMTDGVSAAANAVGTRAAPLTKSVSVGTTSTDTQELNDTAVRQWIGAALDRCSPEDMIVLSEVWKRIEYCDTSTESQGDLRRELIEVFMAPYKYGLKEAIRSRSNATLTRIVDNVAGEYMKLRASAGHQLREKDEYAKKGLAQLMANGQHTTAAIVLYSVVIFCLGIITASYFNLAQPLSATTPFGMVNSTGSVIHNTGDSNMSMMRQILVVDDTPVHKYYTPLRKRSPRSRLGEIMFYWMETLLWDDADTQIPT
ncbi:hypothetical protein H4R23_001223 [Coemansia sp. Cherry 401B]|nr:hypothetical protein H4R23_001223 [Coemansia sp. Cherry 401B]